MPDDLIPHRKAERLEGGDFCCILKDPSCDGFVDYRARQLLCLVMQPLDD